MLSAKPRFNKNVFLYVAAGALVLLAIAIRVFSEKFASADYNIFLLPWFNDIRDHGFRAIATTVSNYNVPYLYLLWLASKLPFGALVGIKLITIAFDVAFCALVYLILRQYKTEKSLAVFAACASAFLPNVLFNGAVWAQCDIIYTVFLLASWLAIAKNHSSRAWFFWGIAFVFKLQAVFFLPFFLYKYVLRLIDHGVARPIFSRKNASLLAPLIPVGVFVVAAIPAMLAGRSFWSIVQIYINQTGGQNLLMSYSAANIWQIVAPASSILPSLGTAVVIFALTILVIILVLFTIKKYTNSASREQLDFVLPLLILLVVPFFLPYMHERYFFAAEIFAFVFALVTKKWLFIASAGALQLTCVIAYSSFLLGAEPGIPFAVAALVNGAVIIALIVALFREGDKTLREKLRGIVKNS